MSTAALYMRVSKSDGSQTVEDPQQRVSRTRVILTPQIRRMVREAAPLSNPRCPPYCDH